MIYILFRNDVIFLELTGFNHLNIIQLGESPVEKFILYNLSDALWALSIMFFVSWQNDRIIRVAGLILPIVMELLQAGGMIPGTFDFIDLSIYCYISISFIILWKRKKEF